MISNFDIVESVDKKIEQIRTKSLDLSFNELLDMYENKELIINPEYQRLFRWNDEKQSRFIESLILEMPIPPIFVIETELGEYELIDGLQRISTYLNFRGSLYLDKPPLTLEGCDIIEELNGQNYQTLPKTTQIKLKRNFIRVEVLRKESDKKLRYYMFKRLNTGGEILSEQEVRNCTIRLLDSEVNDFIAELSLNINFGNTIIKIKEEEIKKKFDQELILRYFSLKNNLDNYFTPFDEYLTNYLERVAKKQIIFDLEQERKNFEDTFEILNKIDGANTFSTLLQKDKPKENFVIYYFEGFTLGIQSHLLKLKTLKNYNDIKNIFDEIKINDSFSPYKTGSKSNIINRTNILKNKLDEYFDTVR